jgi:TetR/AcrR family transcriptional repressor of bet genes
MGKAVAPRFERQLPEERRHALIVATIDCLKAHGHEGMSVRRISAAAGVSIGLINHHFPNKDELVAQAYRHFNDELVAGLRRAVDDERRRFDAAAGEAAGGPRERLSSFFRASFSPPNLDREVLTAWIVFWGLLRHSPQIQRVHSEAYGGYLDLVKSMLTELEKDRGRFSLPCHLAAVGLTALLDGLWLEWCLDPGTFQPDQAVMLCERWVDALHA